MLASNKNEKENEQKTLGVCWNTKEDTLIMRLSTLSDRAREFPATRLFASNSRLVTLAKKTIQRIELLGAFILA